MGSPEANKSFSDFRKTLDKFITLNAFLVVMPAELKQVDKLINDKMVSKKIKIVNEQIEQINKLSTSNAYNKYDKLINFQTDIEGLKESILKSDEKIRNRYEETKLAAIPSMHAQPDSITNIVLHLDSIIETGKNSGLFDSLESLKSRRLGAEGL